jgi:hypothetical protein
MNLFKGVSNSLVDKREVRIVMSVIVSVSCTRMPASEVSGELWREGDAAALEPSILIHATLSSSPSLTGASPDTQRELIALIH